MQLIAVGCEWSCASRANGKGPSASPPPLSTHFKFFLDQITPNCTKEDQKIGSKSSDESRIKRRGGTLPEKVTKLQTAFLKVFARKIARKKGYKKGYVTF